MRYPAPDGADCHGWGNLAVLGSQHSARTLEVREFLTRNGYPYTYIDLDRDQTSQELLDRFEVKAAEVPVVVCNSGRKCAAEPLYPGSRGLPGIQRIKRRQRNPGHNRHRGRPGRAGGGSLRGLRRAECAGDRDDFSRRAGGVEFEDRELPGGFRREFRGQELAARRVRKR